MSTRCLPPYSVSQIGHPLCDRQGLSMVVNEKSAAVLALQDVKSKVWHEPATLISTAPNPMHV
jgi:hypothetical protein